MIKKIDTAIILLPTIPFPIHITHLKVCEDLWISVTLSHKDNKTNFL